MRRFDFADDEAWCAAIVEQLVLAVRTALAAGVPARLVVSGGSTPQPVYQRLAEQDLPWDQVELLLSDERWVPLHDAASNEGMLRRIFGSCEGLRITGLKTGDENPEQACETLRPLLLRQSMPMHLVLLGMGEDGHTASLFPGTDATRAALAPDFDGPCLANEAPDEPRSRISLSPAMLLASKRILLLLRGAGKAAVLERAMQPGAALQYPVRCVLHQQRTPVDVYWAA